MPCHLTDVVIIYVYKPEKKRLLQTCLLFLYYHPQPFPSCPVVWWFVLTSAGRGGWSASSTSPCIPSHLFFPPTLFAPPALFNQTIFRVSTFASLYRLKLLFFINTLLRPCIWTSLASIRDFRLLPLRLFISTLPATFCTLHLSPCISSFWRSRSCFSQVKLTSHLLFFSWTFILGLAEQGITHPVAFTRPQWLKGETKERKKKSNLLSGR